jgi:hypothetical protein
VRWVNECRPTSAAGVSLEEQYILYLRFQGARAGSRLLYVSAIYSFPHTVMKQWIATIRVLQLKWMAALVLVNYSSSILTSDRSVHGCGCCTRYCGPSADPSIPRISPTSQYVRHSNLSLFPCTTSCFSSSTVPILLYWTGFSSLVYSPSLYSTPRLT